MLVMSFITAGVVGLIYTTSNVNFRLNHKVNNILMARQALDRIEAKVRMARLIGDVSGRISLDTGSGYPAARGANYFPSESNPLYRCDSGDIWPTSWPAPPYRISSTTMIVQIPVFDASGFPTAVQFSASEQSPSEQFSHPQLENMDTFIYKVLPDPSAKGEFIIQESVFPGQAPPAPASRREYLPCWTIARGIVGPLGNDGTPHVFQYLLKTDGKEAPYDSLDADSAANIAGIVFNLELKSEEAANQPAPVLGIKSVVYLKNNAQGTVCGATSSGGPTTSPHADQT
jgi:hypothetical protein